MKVLLTGGGTAGHVNPALAIAAALQAYDKDTEVLFVASALPGDKANDLVPRAGYELKNVQIYGFDRRIMTPSNFALPFVMLKSRKQAKAIIEAFQPDLIVGTGGYACWPVVSMGASMGIPTAVHESNAKPGKAIMQVRHKVDQILVNFPETIAKLKLPKGDARVVRVGNPYMSDFTQITYAEARAKLGIPEDGVYILSFGGSLGAEVVNMAVMDMWAKFKDTHKNAYFCHATGKRFYKSTLEAAKERGVFEHPRMALMDYIYDMPLRMAAADVVVSRAGAMSISELALMQKAAVLIPSPNVADNHQYINAMALQDKGAGICVEESSLSDGRLTDAIETLLVSPERRISMGQNAREHFGAPCANQTIVKELLALVSKK